MKNILTRIKGKFSDNLYEDSELASVIYEEFSELVELLLGREIHEVELNEVKDFVYLLMKRLEEDYGLRRVE